jgi:hypothetical protein
MATKWTFPDYLSVGDSVLISRDQTRSDMTYARIIKIKPNAGAVDVEAVFPSGSIVFQHLWHKDDPRVKSESDRFTDSCSGVFCEAPRTLEIVSVLSRMATLEKRFAALERYVAGETETVETTTEAEPPTTEPPDGIGPLIPRPRGRPRREAAGVAK